MRKKTNDVPYRYEDQLQLQPMQDLIEQLGEFFERFGFRRNLGRIWSVIYLSPQPLTQAEVCQLSGLSVGMVSSSLRELEHWGACHVAPSAGTRSKRYEAEEKLLRIVASILAKREVEAVVRLRESVRALRKNYAPPMYAERFEKRLRAIERTTDLYEALAGLISKVASLPISAIDHTMRVVKLARFLDLDIKKTGKKGR